MISKSGITATACSSLVQGCFGATFQQVQGYPCGRRAAHNESSAAASNLAYVHRGPGFTQETTTRIAHYLEPFPGPQVYKDPKSGTTLYVETDGRHVAAISGDGKLLWIRDPFSDSHLEFYRTNKLQIVYIGPVSKLKPYAGTKPDKFVAITFNNSQFGLLTISSGDFQILGQD